MVQQIFVSMVNNSPSCPRKDAADAVEVIPPSLPHSICFRDMQNTLAGTRLKVCVHSQSVFNRAATRLPYLPSEMLCSRHAT
ncbi:hypothetical protein COCC4DRAFT_207169 [Bipolaris maydis ATCC 48331]|uniref:Uncharacterized protein n=1 Tax=Cochliobolus heterostrophus (strain C4 / ATCC 48331 / race T) TaxID=665024 RepID=N4WZG7_COCH4|nr:uncharacterized protein COCC4DRAFT_207169 [Bipolaris maydis ATCC 48331]ENH99780.1 hypothetical protein COCC4DRAFT_207169 [Bipolaris maydis ATCC 48331]